MSSAKSVEIGETLFGAGAPVRVESMLKTPLSDVDGCLLELDALKEAGCELVRIAFPEMNLAPALSFVLSRSDVPIMADIHFNHKLAIKAIESGVKSIRINPGNMESGERLMNLLAAAKDHGTVIRIGSNGGSLSKKHLESQGGDRARALVHAVEEQLLPLVKRGFDDIVISAKSSSVPETVRANSLLSQKYPFPLHIGITEAGAGIDGVVKSAAGLALLLSQGIGDTMRVSLTGPSVEEVAVAYGIQRALGLRHRGIDLISCPGCGRRRIDVLSTVARVKKLLPEKVRDDLTIAVMGCEVNGPKEAAAADLGIAGTTSGFVLFVRGRVIATGSIEEIEHRLQECLEKIAGDIAH